MKEKQVKKSAAQELPELLAPAGSFEKLVTAIHYGADAVYLSGKKYGLRAKAVNFDEEGIRRAVNYAHGCRVRVYVTVNIIAHNADFTGLETYLLMLRKAEVDAIIVSDPGIIQMAAAVVPDLPIHLSTQANVTNRHSAQFWISQGISRLNLARELSIKEIESIRRGVHAELEVFTHGALCISYSGRCMLSNYMTGRDANQGSCAHPCRYSYALMEEKRPEEFFPVYEDERGTYIFNSKDLCLLEYLPQLVAAGVNSLKIEGRMKSIFYVGGVVRVYRAALDYLNSLDRDDWKNPEHIKIPTHFIEEIKKTGTRGMSSNFAVEKPGPKDMLYNSSRVDQRYEPVAVVRETTTDPKEIIVEIRNALHTAEQIEYMHPSIELDATIVVSMRNQKGITIERANPGDRIFMTLADSIPGIQTNSIFRRKKLIQ